jgi:hypothetical protein
MKHLLFDVIFFPCIPLIVSLIHYKRPIQFLNKINFLTRLAPSYKTYLKEHDFLCGFDLTELGLRLTVDESLFKPGKGLLLCVVCDDIKQVIVSQGQILCGYSKGELKTAPSGDRTVSYHFRELSNYVIFNKVLLPLSEIIAPYLENNPFEYMQDLILGHKLSIINDTIGIEINPDFKERYFVPYEPTDKNNITISNVGMYANDMRYDMDSDEYYSENDFDSNNDNANEYSNFNRTKFPTVRINGTITTLFTDKVLLYPKNILQLVWRMEEQNGKIVPTWPVVIFKEDVVMRNRDPIEIGLDYSKGYWDAWKDGFSGRKIDIEGKVKKG